MLLDTGATHNFAAQKKSQNLGVCVSPQSSRLKALNFAAQPVCGVNVANLKVGG